VVVRLPASGRLQANRTQLAPYRVLCALREGAEPCDPAGAAIAGWSGDSM